MKVIYEPTEQDKATFKENLLVYMPHQLIEEDYRKKVEWYFRTTLNAGFFTYGDAQSNRFWQHKNQIATAMQPYLVPFVSKIVGSPVIMSYNYFGCYVEGARLPKHTDRAQCKYTLDFALFADSPDNYVWPIYINEQEVCLKPGESALYMGNDLLHYRHPLPAGNMVANIFFHFVDSDFAEKLD